MMLNTHTRLVVCQFLFGAMLWYGVEQLFINKISPDAGARGLTTITFTLAFMLFDIPGGIFADRVGRKRSLLYGCLVAAASLIILGFSHTLATYLLGAALFGLFIGLHNGAAEALLYDWLASEGRATLYAKYQGRVYAAYLCGAGVANILSGFIANAMGLRSTYFLSLIPLAVGFWLLLALQEPPHIEQHKPGLTSHLGEVLLLLRRKPRILAFGLQLVVTEVLFLTVAEYGQVYMLTFGVSTAILGLLWAIDAGFAAAGRGFAHRVQQRPRRLVVVFCVILAGFALVSNSLGIGLFWLMWGMTEMLANVAETEVQHESTSNVRATTLSVISFAGNAVGVMLLIGYIQLVRHHTIFIANRVIIALCILTLLITLGVKPPQLRRTEQTQTAPKPTI